MDFLCAASELCRRDDRDTNDNSDAEDDAFTPYAADLLRYQSIDDLQIRAGHYKFVKPHDGAFKVEVNSRKLKERVRPFTMVGFNTAKDAASALIDMIDKKRDEMEKACPPDLMMTPKTKVPPPPSTWRWPCEGDTLKVLYERDSGITAEVDATVTGVCTNGWFSAFIRCDKKSGGYIDWFKWNDTDWRYADARYRHAPELAAGDADALLELPRKKKMRLLAAKANIDEQTLDGPPSKSLVKESTVVFSTDAWEKLVSTPNGQQAGRLLQMLRITFSGIEQVQAPSDAAYRVMEDETGQPVWVELLRSGQIICLPVFEHVDGTIFISKTNPSASNVTDNYKEHAVSTYHMLHLLGASAVYFNHMPKEYKPAVLGLPLKVKFPDWSVQSLTAVAKAPPAPPQYRAPIAVDHPPFKFDGFSGDGSKVFHVCACGFRTAGTDAKSVPSVLTSAVRAHEKKNKQHLEWVQKQASQAQSQPSLKATPSPQPNLSVMPKAATCTPTTKFCAMNGDSCLKMPPWCRFCPTCGSKQV